MSRSLVELYFAKESIHARTFYSAISDPEHYLTFAADLHSPARHLFFPDSPGPTNTALDYSDTVAGKVRRESSGKHDKTAR